LKLIIAGTRTLDVRETFISEMCLQFNIDPTEIVSGNAAGIDVSGENYAFWNSQMPMKLFSADWEHHGRAAGPIRNKQMAEYADALLLIWDGESRGSKNMKETMMALKKPVYEVIVRKL